MADGYKLSEKKLNKSLGKMKYTSAIFAAFLLCFVENGEAGIATLPEYINFLNLLTVLETGVSYNIKCSANLWLTSLEFVEEINPRASDCLKDKNPWYCLLNLSVEIKDHFVKIHDEFLKRNCDDLKLDYTLSLIGRWTTLNENVRVQAVRSYGGSSIKPRMESFPEDYAFDFKKLHNMLGSYMLKTAKCIHPFLVESKKLLVKTQSDVAVCNGAAFENQYLCYSKIIDELQIHFKEINDKYPKADCQKQPFDEIVEAYKPIITAKNEKLIAGLKKFVQIQKRKERNR